MLRALLLVAVLGADGGTAPVLPDRTPIAMKHGERRLIRFPCSVQRFAVTSSTLICDSVGGGVWELRGEPVGKSTMLVFCTNGKRLSYPTSVTE